VKPGSVLKYLPRTFFYSLVEVLSGLVGVLTLGVYNPGWDIKFMFWWEMRRHQQLKREGKLQTIHR
jgi:hypothetical protein